MTDKQFTRGYVKGWTDRHHHGDELPADLSNALNELQRLLNREEVGLPIVKSRKPVYVSGARRPYRKPAVSRKNELATYVFEKAKQVLATDGPLMPRDLCTKLLALGDPKLHKYIEGGRQRLGVQLVYWSKCAEPQVRRVSAGYELVNGGAQ